MLPPVLQAQVLDGTDLDKTGIVDEHVDRTGLLMDGSNRVTHRDVVAHIHLQRLERELLLICASIELRALFRGASGGEYPVASAGQ